MNSLQSSNLLMWVRYGEPVFNAKSWESRSHISTIKEFEKNFGESTRLPPYIYIALDHHINLEPGTKPINVHPCRYPHWKIDKRDTRSWPNSTKKKRWKLAFLHRLPDIYLMRWLPVIVFWYQRSMSYWTSCMGPKYFEARPSSELSSDFAGTWRYGEDGVPDT